MFVKGPPVAMTMVESIVHERALNFELVLSVCRHRSQDHPKIGHYFGMLEEMGEKLLKVCVDNSLQPTLAISRWVCPVLVAAEVSTLSPKQVLEQGKPTR